MVSVVLVKNMSAVGHVFTNAHYKSKYLELIVLYLFHNFCVGMWCVDKFLIWNTFPKVSIIEAACECDLQCTFAGIVNGLMWHQLRTFGN